MTLYVSRNGVTEGPYSQSEIEEQLTDGRLSGADAVWQEGWPAWVSLGSLIVSVPMAAPAPKRGRPSREHRSSGATPKQRAFLEYLGIMVPGTKEEASEAIDAAMNDDALAERRSRWTTDRLFLHPDLYRDEGISFRASRIDILHRNVNSLVGDPSHPFKRMTKAQVEDAVSLLCQKRPGWDRSMMGAYGMLDVDFLYDVFLPAVAATHPEVLKRDWRRGG